MASRHLKQRQVELRDLLSQLISSILGSLPGDDNHALALDFCVQNLEERSTLPFNPRTVIQSYSDLESRLERHSQLRKAEVLHTSRQALCSVGLSGVYGDADCGVLGLLLDLANRPLDSPVPLPPAPHNSSAEAAPQHAAEPDATAPALPAGRRDVRQLRQEPPPDADDDHEDRCQFSSDSDLSDWVSDEDADSASGAASFSARAGPMSGADVQQQKAERLAKLKAVQLDRLAHQGAGSHSDRPPEPLVPPPRRRQGHEDPGVSQLRPDPQQDAAAGLPCCKGGDLLTALARARFAGGCLLASRRSPCDAPAFLARQILAVLSGHLASPECFAWCEGDGAAARGFHACASLQVSHLSPLALHQLLRWAAATGTAARDVRQLCAAGPAAHLVLPAWVWDGAARSSDAPRAPTRPLVHVARTPCLAAFLRALLSQVEAAVRPLVALLQQLSEAPAASRPLSLLSLQNRSSAAAERLTWLRQTAAGTLAAVGAAWQAAAEQQPCGLGPAPAVPSTAQAPQPAHHVAQPAARVQSRALLCLVSTALLDDLYARLVLQDLTGGPAACVAQRALLHLFLSAAGPVLRGVQGWLGDAFTEDDTTADTLGAALPADFFIAHQAGPSGSSSSRLSARWWQSYRMVASPAGQALCPAFLLHDGLAGQILSAGHSLRLLRSRLSATSQAAAGGGGAQGAGSSLQAGLAAAMGRAGRRTSDSAINTAATAGSGAWWASSVSAASPTRVISSAHTLQQRHTNGDRRAAVALLGPAQARGWWDVPLGDTGMYRHFLERVRAHIGIPSHPGAPVTRPATPVLHAAEDLSQVALPTSAWPPRWARHWKDTALYSLAATPACEEGGVTMAHAASRSPLPSTPQRRGASSTASSIAAVREEGVSGTVGSSAPVGGSASREAASPLPREELTGWFAQQQQLLHRGRCMDAATGDMSAAHDDVSTWGAEGQTRHALCRPLQHGLWPPGSATASATSLTWRLQLTVAGRPPSSGLPSGDQGSGDALSWLLDGPLASPGGSCGGDVPAVTPLLQRCLRPLVMERVTDVSQELMACLARRHGLAAELSHLRGVFLLAAPAMQHFCARVLAPVMDGQPFTDVPEHEVEAMLQEALSSASVGEELPPADAVSVQMDSRNSGGPPGSTSNAASGDTSRHSKDSSGDSHRAGLSSAGVEWMSVRARSVAELDALRVVYPTTWLAAILTHQEGVMQACNQAFVFLLQLRWARSALDSLRQRLWKQARARRTWRRPKEHSTAPGAASGRHDGGAPQHLAERDVELAQQEMVHFVQNLAQFTSERLLVDACGVLNRGLEAAASLADVQALVTDFLATLARVAGGGQSLVSSQSSKTWQVAGQLFRKLLDQVLNFCGAATGLYQLDDASRVGQAVTVPTTLAEQQLVRSTLTGRLSSAAREFRGLLRTMLRILSSQGGATGAHMAPLLERLNFNGFYQSHVMVGQ